MCQKTPTHITKRDKYMTEKAECVLWTVIKKSVSRNKRDENILHQKTPAYITERDKHMTKRAKRVLWAVVQKECVKKQKRLKHNVSQRTHAQGKENHK